MCLHHPDFAKLKENMLNCCFYSFDWFCHPREREKNIQSKNMWMLRRKMQFFHFNDSTVAITRSFGTVISHLITGKEHCCGICRLFPSTDERVCTGSPCWLSLSVKHMISCYENTFLFCLIPGEEHKNTAKNEETIVNWYISLVFLFIYMCLSKIHVFVLFY